MHRSYFCAVALTQVLAACQPPSSAAGSRRPHADPSSEPGAAQGAPRSELEPMLPPLEKQDVQLGTGPEAKQGDTVLVHYTGTLRDGTQFDSSLDRGAPLEFTLGSGMVIAGWDIGIAGMKAGGKRKLIIPPHLGYGMRGSPPKIPPDATLVFDVELVEVLSAAGPADSGAP